MLSLTLRKSLPSHLNHADVVITRAQSQQISRLSLDALLRRLQSSSLTNPARSLEVHFEFQPPTTLSASQTPLGKPSIPQTTQPRDDGDSDHDGRLDRSDDDMVPLRVALSEALWERTGLATSAAAQGRRGPAPAPRSTSRPALSPEEWGLLAGNALRHGLDGGLTRLAVRRALETGQADALIRVLEACVDGEVETSHHTLAALSLEALDQLVGAVEKVWDGPDGWRAADGDLSLYSLFSQFLALTLVSVSTGAYYDANSSGTTGESKHTQSSTASSSPSPARPAPPARRWPDVRLPRLALTMDPNLVMARCVRLCTDVCQHLVEQLGASGGDDDGTAQASRSRGLGSLSEALRLCHVADHLSCTANTPVGALGESSTASQSVSSSGAHEAAGVARSLMVSWLPFARNSSTAATTLSTSSLPLPPQPQAGGSPSSSSAATTTGNVGDAPAKKSESELSRMRLAAQVRRVALSQLSRALSDLPASPRPSHPLLGSLSLVDAVVLFRLTCAPSLPQADASPLLSRLSVHLSLVLAGLARGDRGMPRGPAPPPVLVSPHSLHDPATLGAVLSIGELHLSLGGGRGTETLFASVLQCVDHAAPILWRGATSELWNRACALVNDAPLIVRDAAERTAWALATAASAHCVQDVQADRHSGLLTLTRLVTETGVRGDGTTRGNADVRRALVATTASQSLIVPFSEQGVAGLKGAVRTLSVFTLFLAAHGRPEDAVTGVDGRDAELMDVCWHVVAKTLESMQLLSSQLSTPARPWTSLLSASEMSVLRQALRWASSVPRSPQTTPTIDTTTAARDSVSLPTTGNAPVAGQTNTPNAPASPQRQRRSPTPASHARRERPGREATTKAGTDTGPPHSSPTDLESHRVASLSDALHQQIVWP